MGSIREFYKGKSIFVTGASGFMGKVLVEKILYSCSDVKQIFILMREKRGKSGPERVAEFSSLPLFQRIVKEKPEVLDKIVPVYGDICLINLGLSDEDVNKVINETNVLFHMAATVNFEAPLKTAVEMNVRGVHYVMEMAKKMCQLHVMLHLSTTFCCCDQEVLHEKVYDWDLDPKKLIKCTEWMTEDMMNLMKPAIVAPHPNTYTFTKRMAELLVRDEYPNLPICIARPSIVLPSYSEPFPGWVDNLNGAVGVVLGAGKGVIRSMLCDRDVHAEVVPVDLAINGLLIIAYNFSMKEEKPETIPVYNLTIPECYRYSWGTLLDLGRKTILAYPFDAGIWYPGGDITTNKVLHYTRVFFTQWIPAYLVDGLCGLVGRKKFLVNVQKKIHMGMNMLQYFSMRKWDFRLEKGAKIGKFLTSEEDEIFPSYIDKPDIEEYMKSCILGGRQYCLKEPLTSLPKARVQLKILRVLDYFTSFLWILLFGWIVKVLVTSFVL